MKGKIQSSLLNGVPFGLGLFGLSFLAGYYTFDIGLQKTLQISTITGIAALLVNGFMYNRFAKPLKGLEEISINLESSELLIIEAPANHTIHESSSTGKLFLTNNRMVFKTYEKDKKSREFSWYLIDLKPINFYGSIWNTGGEFLLKTQDGFTLVFEVNKIKPWKYAFKSE